MSFVTKHIRDFNAEPRLEQQLDNNRITLYLFFYIAKTHYFTNKTPILIINVIIYFVRCFYLMHIFIFIGIKIFNLAPTIIKAINFTLVVK